MIVALASRYRSASEGDSMATSVKHWSRNNRSLIELVIGTMVLFAFNVWEHLPGIIPNHYSDVISVFWRDGVGRGEHLVPYLQFTFEYPVIVGVLVYISSFSRALAPDFMVAMNYYVLIMDGFLFLFTIGTVLLLRKICLILNIEETRIWKFFLIMPTFLMFTVYNWDIIAVFFSVLSIYLYMKTKKLGSAVSLGLGIAAKLYPSILLPVYLVEEKSWRERFKFIFTSLGVFMLLNAPFIILNFETWLSTWTYHMEWGIEDSWLIYFFKQMDPFAHYFGLAVLLYLVYKGLIQTSKKLYESQAERLIERCWLMSIAWLFGSYVATPQMALMLLPFYTLIPTIPLLPAYIADVLNALIIVLWFTSTAIIGDPVSPNSPVQYIAATRQLIWLGMFIYCLYKIQITGLAKTLFKRIEK